MPDDIAWSADALVRLLRAAHLPYTTEAIPQAAVEDLLRASGVSHDREKPLSGSAGRPDFLVGRVAIECKVQGAPAAIAAQVARYAASDEVDAVILLTSKAVSVRAEQKPVAVVVLSTNWL